MQKYLPELLTEINNNPALLETMRNDSALTVLFRYAFVPENKFLLPEGNPPFKPDAAPIGMSMGTLRQELKRLYVFCRADISSVRREDLFVQLLEAVHPSEATLLLAIKDQTLTRLYPNITHQLVFDNEFVKNVPPVKTPKESKTKKSTGVAE